MSIQDESIYKFVKHASEKEYKIKTIKDTISDLHFKSVLKKSIFGNKWGC